MDWKNSSKEKRIEKEFAFGNFSEALAFVNIVGELAERANHHPDILIHDYKKVTIMLTTHDAGQVTDKDYNLANQIDKAFQDYIKQNNE